MSPSENICTDESDLTATGAVKATTSRLARATMAAIVD